MIKRQYADGEIVTFVGRPPDEPDGMPPGYMSYYDKFIGCKAEILYTDLVSEDGCIYEVCINPFKEEAERRIMFAHHNWLRAGISKEQFVKLCTEVEDHET